MLLLISSQDSHAEGGLILIDPPPADYSLSIGPGVTGFGDYPGAKGTKLVPVPGLDLYGSAGGFASTDIGLGWNFSRGPNVQFGVRLWPVFGRSGDEANRRGLSDIGTRLGKGLFLNYAPWSFLILQSGVLSGSATSGRGIQGEIGATSGFPLGDRGLVGLTLAATWSNGAYMRSYYGVSADDSRRGGLPVYAPGAGWSDVNALLTGEFKLSDRWSLSGEVGKARLIGGAGRSPVVESRIQPTFSTTLWYRLK